MFRYPPDGFWTTFTHKIPVSQGGVETTKAHAVQSLTSPMHAGGIVADMAMMSPQATSSPASGADNAQSTPVAAAARAPSEEHNDVFARLFRPKAALCDGLFEVSIDSQHFISFPTNVTPGDRVPKLWNAALPESARSGEATLDEWAKHAAEVSDRHEISLFNVIFAVDLPAGMDLKAGKRSAFGAVEHDDIDMLCDAVQKLSACLMHEQRRVRYVSSQVQMLQDIKEQSAHPYDNTALVAAQLERSRLAEELVAMYTGLLRDRAVHLDINRWIRLSLGLADPSRCEFHPCSVTSCTVFLSIALEDAACGVGCGDVLVTVAIGVVSLHRLAKLSMRPYHTVLLTKSKDEVCKELPPDASPQLRRLIDAANPLKSFAMLQVPRSCALANCAFKQRECVCVCRANVCSAVGVLVFSSMPM